MTKSKHLLKRFVAYYKPHWKLFALDMFCALCIALIDLAFPIITRYTLNELLPNKAVRLFFVVILAMVVIYGVRALFEFIVNYWGHILGVRMEYDMRNDLFTHLQKQSFDFYDKNRTGKIMSRVINDLFEITELAHHGPEDLFLSVFMLIGSFIILLTVQWKLAVIVYIFVPIMILFAMRQRIRMREGFKNVKKKVAKVNAQLESSLSGIRVSKSFANEEYEMDKFKEGNMEFRGSKDIAYKNMAIFMMGINVLSNALNLTVLVVGFLFILTDQMNLPDMLAFMLYINIFMQPIRRLSNFAQQFESGMTGFERFCDIMDQEPTIQDKKDAVPLEEVNGHIGFQSVSFAYNESESVLEDINLDIEAGKTLALVGPSGGGKTTLCHLIPRFYEIGAGSITVDDKDIRDLTIESLRKNIGLVSQDVFLFAGTIRDNIMYGRINATESEMMEAAKNAEIHDFIMGLQDGYDTEVGERGIRLSGGQKQRIAIARVFLKNPPILILDEATSALDNETEIKIQRALEKLSHGRTTLVIAHRLSTIKDADEIVVISPNGIEEKGNHETLLELEGIYAKLYKAQFKGFIPDEVN
ncbi:ABC transporter ATP-binding protein [Vallitalea okinawensis]|uniref:ABC transporter ATP-binding protein n=1 Tax=Vallitalea okinawensis TaxID=2078660 RepID=UPI00241E3E45|nr:ABC transporter ATP-binding protein [Vallitalea okinawensis]